MRFYTGQHGHYCGVDLHTKKMYLCVLDHEAGKVRLHRNMAARPESLLTALEPYKDDVVVGCECMFSWYWLADLCAEQKIPFVLGHALYMKAIHGGKSGNDRIDSRKIAGLLRGGLLPQAYVYPRGMRSTRDLLRRRTRFVRQRAQLLSHIKNTNSQYNLEPFNKRIAAKKNREELAERFAEDESVMKSIEADCALADHYDDVTRELELFINQRCKAEKTREYYLMRSIPGVGKILTLTILYEIHDIDRFPRVQELASYACLIRGKKESAGKLKGLGGRKMGNLHLKWAFSEAVTLFLMRCPEAKKACDRWEKKMGKRKARARMAHKLGRTTYFMLKRKQPFDVQRFTRQL